MDNEKMGRFIASLRKSHQMTQKELAAKLDVSDKAVSKWERGQSYPDISLLSPLCAILGITTTELLNGERASQEAVSVETSVVNALEYVDKTAQSKIKFAQSILAAIFSILILLGIFVVSIVNVAISGTFTWALIPIAACIFAWLICFPAIKFGMKGVVGSLIAFSLLIVPFLYALSYAINTPSANNTPIFSMGVRIAPITSAFFWIVFLMLKKCRLRKLVTLAVLALLASPLALLISFMIARALGQPWLNVWTVFNASTPLMIAIILFIIDVVVQRKNTL